MLCSYRGVSLMFAGPAALLLACGGSVVLTPPTGTGGRGSVSPGISAGASGGQGIGVGGEGPSGERAALRRCPGRREGVLASSPTRATRAPCLHL